MGPDAANLPVSIPGRLLWIGKRLLLWLLLFGLLDAGGTWLLLQVPRPLTGPYILLQTTGTLIAATVAGILLLKWLDQRRARDLGFDLSTRAGSYSAVGVGVGVAVLLMVCALMLVVGWLGFRADDGSPGGWLVTVVRDFVLLGIAAAAEEAVFRGYAFQTLARGAGPVVAIVVGSSIFAWGHAQNPNVGNFALLNIFLAGILLSVSFLLTQSLWFATAVHVGWNWSMASLLDLPVSGLEIMDTPLYDAELHGPEWFTGGAFGPEGGLAGTIAFGAALGIVWWYARRYARVEPT
ncbi:MAG: CPBP family intramembrane glutamic endopeptidase [Gemmatimonadota bacterium]